MRLCFFVAMAGQHEEAMSTQRLLAVILSIGGICWGIFCLPFLFWNPSYSMLIFGPGYVVTIGYLVRACSTPSLESRVGIWILSALVQGIWLIWACCGIFQGARFRGHAFEFVTLGWWVFAFVASVYAILNERYEKAPDLVPPGDRSGM
jgi:hypothetical protein